MRSAAVDAIHTTSAAAHLTLQLGYFKAKRRFFVYDREKVLDDLRYTLQQYFPDRDLAFVKALSKPTRLELYILRFWILRVFGYRFAPRYRDLHKRIDTLVVSFRQ